MPSERRARMDATGRRVAVVAARFNDFVTRRLVEGAVDTLRAHGIEDGAIEVYWVPGAFEIPQMAAKIARDGRCDGIVTLGALVRGETAHFDVLAGAVTTALERLGTETQAPIAFGVITADTMEQAIDRAGGKHGHAGRQAAQALVEMMDLWRD
jgi:6,7-dimethyl-8-ribityllumazine synthase